MTKARLEKLCALTRGAAVLGATLTGLGGAAVGCDHSSGDTQVPPLGTAPIRVNAPPADPDPSASASNIPMRRMPIPNAMPRSRMNLNADAGTPTPTLNPDAGPPTPPISG